MITTVIRERHAMRQTTKTVKQYDVGEKGRILRGDGSRGNDRDGNTKARTAITHEHIRVRCPSSKTKIIFI